MLFKKLPQLKYSEVVRGLKKLGFVMESKKSTAHEQWVAQDPFRKVTVDKHEAPFSKYLVQSMAKQAGLSPREFCKYCKDKKYNPSKIIEQE